MSAIHFRVITRCAIYTRQSRETDGEFSSCEAQYEACFQFVRGHVLEGWNFQGGRYDDSGHSGENLNRPGMKRLLEDIDAGRIDRLVVYRLDRLSRSVLHFSTLMARLRERGVELSLVATPDVGASASDAFMLNILASFAEFEREIIRARLAESRAAHKARGRRVAGAVPYGYITDPATKQLITEPAEARRVKAIFERAAKGETPRQIAEHANRYGWRTKRGLSRRSGQVRGGNRWTPRQILDTLQNPTYVGLIRNGNGTAPGAHEPLVTRELFDRAAEQVARRRTQKTSRRSNAEAGGPLTGLLFCGRCGRPMSINYSGYRMFRYRYYRCRSHAGGRPPCRGVSFPAAELEGFVCRMLADMHAGGTRDASDFSSMWSALSERDQLALLPEVVERVEVDSRVESLKLTLVPGAFEAVSGSA